MTFGRLISRFASSLHKPHRYSSSRIVSSVVQFTMNSVWTPKTSAQLNGQIRDSLSPSLAAKYSHFPHFDSSFSSSYQLFQHIKWISSSFSRLSLYIGILFPSFFFLLSSHFRWSSSRFFKKHAISSHILTYYGSKAHTLTLGSSSVYKSLLFYL